MQVCMNSVLLVSLRNSVDFAVAVTCSCSLALSLYWLIQIECMYSRFKLDWSLLFCVIWDHSVFLQQVQGLFRYSLHRASGPYMCIHVQPKLILVFVA